MKTVGGVVLYLALLPGLVLGFVTIWAVASAIGESPAFQTIGNWVATAVFVGLGLWFVWLLAAQAWAHISRALEDWASKP